MNIDHRTTDGIDLCDCGRRPHAQVFAGDRLRLIAVVCLPPCSTMGPARDTRLEAITAWNNGARVVQRGEVAG